MAMTLQEMKDHQAALLQRIEDLRREDDMTGNAAEALNSALDEAERLTGDIERAERAEALTQKIAQPNRKVRLDGSVAKKAPGTFADENEFFRALANIAYRNHVDPRLTPSNTSGDLAREGTGGDGGYLLPVDKRSLQVLLTQGNDTICGRTDILLTPSNAVTIPVDDDAQWSTIMGAADVSEGGTLTETKPSFKSLTLALVKKGVLVRVTSEMLEDGTNIGPYVLNKTASKLRWALDKTCFTAFHASGAKVAVAYSGNRDGTTKLPTLAGIQKMWTSMLVEHRQNAIWIANPQLETVFQNYTIGSYAPAYLPAGGISGAPYSTIYGRPVIFSELAGVVGASNNATDLTLVDPTSFFCVLKSGGPRTDVSIHSEFAKDVVGYRSFVRVVCASKFSSQITRGDGSSVAGNVVTIASS
jgi:HK97 family phage major capsid protein